MSLHKYQGLYEMHRLTEVQRSSYCRIVTMYSSLKEPGPVAGAEFEREREINYIFIQKNIYKKTF